MFNHVDLFVEFEDGMKAAIPAIQLDVESPPRRERRPVWTRGSHPDTTSWKNYRKTQYR